MFDVTLPVRDLYVAVLSHKSGSLWQRVLLPWTRDHPEQSKWLAAFADRGGTPIPPATHEESWHLYALSRVSQVLLLGFQSGRADGTDWPGPQITGLEYAAFWSGLGLTVEPERPFSPFYHEIVEVEQSRNEDEAPLLIGTFWPALTLGPLLFSRAGACITSGRQYIIKEISEPSTLYWAYWRKNRSCHDLSHGWGSNSQWRTSFRRDYRLAGRFWYNVDGTHDLTVPVGTPDRDGLTAQERIELLTHRAFVVTDKPNEDLWPYDDAFSTVP